MGKPSNAVDGDVTARTPAGHIRSFGKREVAVGIGNFMEWFDFAIYGYFAVVIANEFFPKSDPTAALMSTFAVFAVGFLARPLGALILGPLGDRFGRRFVLMVSVLVMGSATALIGLLPNYAAIGVAAPVLMTILRFIQGLSVGGEWTSSAMFLVESAPNHQRATRASIISATAGLAFVSGTGAALLINAFLSPEQVHAWGWRIPFVASVVMGVVAVYIRRNLEDTPVFEQVKERREDVGGKLEVSKTDYRRGFYLTLAIAGIFGVSLYMFVTYMITYLQNVVAMATVTAYAVTLIALMFYAFMNPAAGILSDRVGRRPIALASAGGFAILGIPLFLMISTGNTVLVLVGLLVWGTLQSLIAVMGVVLIVEVFPAPVRSTGAALGYNVAYALLAGPAPLLSTWLVSKFGVIAPAYYLVLVAAICFIVMYKMLPETRFKDLHE
ncbi:MFS transporter [Pseudoglutamicibacter cumminsii]|uniref:MFS transporter n=1 Tax=Pseudoglutamicibacter cumminsii TaxID=156979 RepID=UPI0025559421|nr:MFS transporter [Pseudoglutamicibacter cumminsii]MDK7084027.1 MFS transporter [Pseudoglutamicibacter cumminsii]